MSKEHIKLESFRLLQETLTRKFGASSGLSAVQSSALYSTPKRPCDVEAIRWETQGHLLGKYKLQNIEKVTYDTSQVVPRQLLAADQLTCLGNETIHSELRVTQHQSCDAQLHPMLSVQTPDTVAVYAGQETHHIKLDLTPPLNPHTTSKVLSGLNTWIEKPQEGVFTCAVTDTPLRTTEPRQYKLSAESCGLRLNGQANKSIAMSALVYNGDQHHLQWGAITHRFTEKDTTPVEAHGMSLIYHCNGEEQRAFEGLRQGFKDFMQKFADQTRKWLNQLALNARLTEVQYRSDLQLWQGENHLLWGFAELQPGQVELASHFHFKGNAFEWSLQCGGLMNHPSAKGRLNFTLRAELPLNITSNPSMGTNLVELFSPCLWPIEVHAKVEFDPIFEDVRLIQNMRVGPGPLAFGLLSIKPQPDNAGLEWCLHLDFKEFNVVLSESVLGGTQAEKIITLCPSSMLINWRMG